MDAAPPASDDRRLAVGLKLVGLHALAGVALAFPALINGYPLVYADTGTYIEHAWTLLPSADRTVGYGFIIRAVTWLSTLWLVPLFQGLLASWLLWSVQRVLVPEARRPIATHFATAGLLMACTSLPWYVAQVMPDVMTPLLGLVLFLLFAEDPGNRWRRAWLWCLAFFLCWSHASHLALMVCAWAAAIAVGLVRRKRLARPGSHWRNAVALGAGMLLLWAVGAGYNARHGLRPAYAPASHVFLAGRLCEAHVLRDFLRRHCDDDRYALCRFREELPVVPTEFLWGESSIVSRLGAGMAGADSLLEPVVRDLLRDPAARSAYLRTVLSDGLVQLTQVDAASGLHPYGPGTAPWTAITQRLRGEATQYQRSRQTLRGWEHPGVNRVIGPVLLLACAVLLAGWRAIACNARLALLVLGAAGWVAANAFITAGLANVYDRLQSRVAWLLVFAAWLVLLRMRHDRRAAG
jgi:hypothetical protein